MENTMEKTDPLIDFLSSKRMGHVFVLNGEEVVELLHIVNREWKLMFKNILDAKNGNRTIE